MDIRGLGYIGIDVSDLAAWRSYSEALGAMVTPLGGDAFRLKLDERPFRILVQSADNQEGLAFAGWELPNEAALDQACRELEAAGFNVEPSTEELRRARLVRGLVRTTDPGGFDVELFWGTVHDHEPFSSAAGVSGFVTGDLGLGHIVLGTRNIHEAIPFYTEVLGFRVSDYMGEGDSSVIFTHCNPRHHSLALMGAAESELYHFMLEVETLDDVGFALDRHRTLGIPISRGLGRHSNDQMVSFYSRSPSGFDVEFGCGGIRIDDATWSVSEITKASVWGHHPEAGV